MCIRFGTLPLIASPYGVTKCYGFPPFPIHFRYCYLTTTHTLHLPRRSHWLMPTPTYLVALCVVVSSTRSCPFGIFLYISSSIHLSLVPIASTPYFAVHHPLSHPLPTHIGIPSLLLISTHLLSCLYSFSPPVFMPPFPLHRVLCSPSHSAIFSSDF